MGHDQRVRELRELMALAQQPSSDSRRRLLRSITDVFVRDPGIYSQAQNTCLGEIMGRLAVDLERQVRSELAEKLAAEPEAPHNLIRELAHDEILVAKPVLERSPVLTEDDLISVSATQSQAHLQVITTRPDIGPRLSDAIVEHGDDSVVEGLLRNQTARIGDRAMERVADRAKTSDTLPRAIVDRNDVPPRLLSDILDHLGDSLQNALSGRLTADQSGKLRQVVADLRQKILSQDTSRVELYIDELMRIGSLSEAMLVRFALQKKPMEFMVGIARMADLTLPSAQQLMADDTGKALVIVCRSLDFSPDGFKAIVQSPVTGIPSDTETVQTLLRAYVRLKRTTAQRVLRFWHMRQSIDGSDSDGELRAAS